MTCGVNHGLCKAGIRVLLCISGLKILIQINTNDRIKLKLSIHLYLQRLYVISPANGRKKEYHRRVSPIVRIGGRSSEIHIPTMKQKKMASPIRVSPPTITGFLPRQAAKAPKPQKCRAAMARVC